MLITKASDVSNVENTVNGPKIVDLPSGQGLEATVTNLTIITTPLPDLHTTSQQEEFSQANQLSSIDSRKTQRRYQKLWKNLKWKVIYL